MYSATQASSSSHINATTTAADALKTPQLPRTRSSFGPITNNQKLKNTVSRHLAQEALADADVNIPSGSTKESRRVGGKKITDAITSIPFVQERFPSPAGDSEAADPSGLTTALSPHPATYGDQAVLQSTWVNLVQIMREIEGFYELEARQGDEIKALSEQLFAAAWQASMSTPQEIQYRCLRRITDLLGEGVGRLASLDGKYLRREGKLPERSPSWDFGDLAPGLVLPRGTEKRWREEPSEDAITVDSTATTNAPTDACSPSKRRRLETERLFNLQEVSWAAQVFEEEESEPQGDGGDDTDPDSDGTEPDSDGTEEPSAPQASTSPTSSSSKNIAHPLATTPPQRPRPLQRASTSYDLSFNGSLSALPNPPTPTPATPRPKMQQKVRPQNIPAPYSQAAGTWQEKGVLERCWDGWGYINGRLYLNARNEVSRDRMATEWIDRMI